MELIDRLKALQFRFSRTLLSSWIKPTILGVENLNLGDDDAVCYVLPFRSTADLLVTDKCCENAGLPRPSQPINHLDEKRAVFFVGHPEGRLGRRTQRHQSMRMTRLFSHPLATGKAIKIVPVSIFWGHQPDREKSVFKLILSENWSVTSSFKKLLAIIFHPGHILVQYSAPVNLSEIIVSEPDPKKQIRKLLRVLRVHFNHQRQAIIGPDLSHRRTLINTMLTSNNVMAVVHQEATENNESLQIVEQRALSYAKEISSHQSYRVIRFFQALLTWFWNKLYDGFDINNIEDVKLLARSHEIIYIPCHRSHIDYLLMSYVLYHNGLAPPHIAAGKNLNLPLIGPLLRRAGAFFMRRSFQGDALYKTIFDEYLHQMFTRGYSVEYFIEGSRSRTGRTLTPKIGMLSMTLKSFQRDSSRPMCLMPVYFGYERVLEVATYMGELTGENKKTESIFDIFGVLRSFKYSFGKVSVNFGEPLILDTFLDKHLPAWREPESLTETEFHTTCQRLAETLATRINSATAVNPITLVATALLCTPRQTMEEQQLLQQIELLRTIAAATHYGDKITITALPGPEIIEAAINIAGVKRQEHAFGATISTTPELAAMLAYYRNNVANIFAMPSLTARYVRCHVTTTSNEVTEFIRTLYPYLHSEFLLPDNDIESLVSTTLTLLNDTNLIDIQSTTITTPEPTSSNYTSLTYLSEIIEPTLERFYIVVALLESNKKLSLAQLETDASSIAQKLSILYGINSPTFFDPALFANFIRTLKNNNMLNVNDTSIDNQGVTITNDFTLLSTNTADTLDTSLRYHVLQAVTSN